MGLVCNFLVRYTLLVGGGRDILGEELACRQVGGNGVVDVYGRLPSVCARVGKVL